MPKRGAVSIKAITGVADSDEVEENVDDGDVDDEDDEEDEEDEKSGGCEEGTCHSYDEDIYIMMQCVFVCHEKSSLPTSELSAGSAK